jgi:hypothetical protein
MMKIKILKFKYPAEIKKAIFRVAEASLLRVNLHAACRHSLSFPRRRESNVVSLLPFTFFSKRTHFYSGLSSLVSMLFRKTNPFSPFFRKFRGSPFTIYHLPFNISPHRGDKTNPFGNNNR